MKTDLKDIRGWNGLYKASRNGAIWSVKYKKFLSPFANKNGYYQVRLYNKKRVEQHQLSRLIYQTFKGIIPKGYHVHHLNGRRDCNNLDNLAIMNGHEHLHMHFLGNQYALGCKRSEQTKRKISIKMKESWKKRRVEKSFNNKKIEIAF